MRVLTVQQLAAAFGVHVDQVDAWLEYGLPCMRVRGGLVLVFDLEAIGWVERHTTTRRVGPFDDAERIVARIEGATTTAECAWIEHDVGELRKRGAVTRRWTAETLDWLARVRIACAVDEERRQAEDRTWRDDGVS